MTEQLTLKQMLRHGTAVQRNERAMAAMAVVVNAARQPFLAGTGLALDQQRYITVLDPRNQLNERL